MIVKKMDKTRIIEECVHYDYIEPETQEELIKKYITSEKGNERRAALKSLLSKIAFDNPYTKTRTISELVFFHFPKDCESVEWGMYAMDTCSIYLNTKSPDFIKAIKYTDNFYNILMVLGHESRHFYQQANKALLLKCGLNTQIYKFSKDYKNKIKSLNFSHYSAGINDFKYFSNGYEKDARANEINFVSQMFEKWTEEYKDEEVLRWIYSQKANLEDRKAMDQVEEDERMLNNEIDSEEWCKNLIDSIKEIKESDSTINVCQIMNLIEDCESINIESRCKIEKILMKEIEENGNIPLAESLAVNSSSYGLLFSKQSCCKILNLLIDNDKLEAADAFYTDLMCPDHLLDKPLKMGKILRDSEMVGIGRKIIEKIQENQCEDDSDLLRLIKEYEITASEKVVERETETLFKPNIKLSEYADQRSINKVEKIANKTRKRFKITDDMLNKVEIDYIDIEK